jgi:hypothetical protein
LNRLNVWNHLSAQVDQSLFSGTFIDTEGGAWRPFLFHTGDAAVLALRKQLMKSHACYLLFSSAVRNAAIITLTARTEERDMSEEDLLRELDQKLRGLSVESLWSQASEADMATYSKDPHTSILPHVWKWPAL